MITPQDIAYRRFVAIRADNDYPCYGIFDGSKGYVVKTIEPSKDEATIKETYRRAMVEAARMNVEDFRERKAMRSMPVVRPIHRMVDDRPVFNLGGGS